MPELLCAFKLRLFGRKSGTPDPMSNRIVRQVLVFKGETWRTALLRPTRPPGARILSRKGLEVKFEFLLDWPAGIEVRV